MNYSIEDLVKIARRDNNNKRGYLVVDPLQGKHVPVKPSEALKLFGKLFECVKSKYDANKVLVVGFAETATAIGAHVAVQMGTRYIQTTREVIENVDYLFFSEEHSHATEQKLIKNDIDSVIKNIDRIIFVEDEVTTGNTIMNIIKLLRSTYEKEIKYTILSLLNGMNQESLEQFVGQDIDIYYVLKTEHGNYEEISASYVLDGKNVVINNKTNVEIPVVDVTGHLDARRLVDGNQYHKACSDLASKVLDNLNFSTSKSILVIGTEEFMYPSLYVGYMLEGLGYDVRCHSTTRSPISVSMDKDYPVHIRYELESVYDKNRKTYIYDINKYDSVLIVTDSKLEEDGQLNSLINAVRVNNDKINVVRWN